MNKFAPTIRNRDEQESIEAIGRFGRLFGNGWLIAAVALSVAALGIFHALTAIPLYEASAVIQIKRSPSLGGDFRPEDAATTEMEILRSRSILSRVVQRLQLDVKLDPAPPSLAGVVRNIGADATAGDHAAPALDKVQVARFDVPPSLFKRPFVLTVTADHGFTLVNDQLGIRIDGTTGTMTKVRSRFGDIGVLVAGNSAAPGSRFLLRRISPVQATGQLQRALAVSENAKQSNVVRLALQGDNPQLMSRILGEIVNEYIRQRGAEQRDEASALEASYARQLDESKAALRDADDRYARLLERTGVSDPEAESQSLLQQSNALELQLAEAEQRRAELSSRLGDGHPAIKAINLQVADAGLTLRRLAARREALARAERELAKIRRDRQALNEGVLTLFSQRSKVDAMLSAEGDSVRLLDRPETPLQAVTPGVSTMIILSCFGGLAAGLFASFLKNAILRRKRPRVLPQREMRFRLISLARTESTEAS